MLADSQEVGAGDTAPILKWHPRLRVLIAVAMEALKGTELQRPPSERHGIIARIERLALQRATTVSFRIDDIDVVQYIQTRRAFALKLPDGQPIVAVRTPATISWQVIDDSLGAICEAIEQAALEPRLRLLLYALANDDAKHRRPCHASGYRKLCNTSQPGRARYLKPGNSVVIKDSASAALKRLPQGASRATPGSRYRP